MIELTPLDSEARRNLAFSLARIERFDEAFVQAAQLVQHHPEDPETHYCVALLFASYGNFEEALAHVETALTQRPDWEQARALRDSTRVSIAAALTQTGKAGDIKLTDAI